MKLVIRTLELLAKCLTTALSKVSASTESKDEVMQPPVLGGTEVLRDSPVVVIPVAMVEAGMTK
jgi:hypothetical protein